MSSLNVYPDKELLENSDMVVVDIRTEMEWMQTGVVPGCKTVTFFQMDGSYDAEGFMKAMDALGGKEKEIGFICRTGSRTAQVAMFMKQQGYNVKNLAGGVMKLMSEGYELVPYKG
ncbi:rhodanese-like domain-containing protein [Thiomicrolovo sp. ZZH C-3]|uniref:Rhodanese-like domain-containing protein n=1 Tax=Sulfurimonas diazotrophicus TaxID=3131939 RepID=A0ABZ3HDK7_9BACT